MGAGRSAAEIRDARGDGDGPRRGSDLRAQSLQHRVRRPGGVLRHQRDGPHGDWRPAGVPGTQRHAGRSGGHDPFGAVRENRRRSGPLRRHAGCFRSGAGARASGGLHAGRRRQHGGCPASGRSLPRGRRPPTRRSKPCGSTGNIRWARSTWKRRMRRSMCWPTAGFSTRRFRAVSGRAADTTSPAAPSASAISCRTRWRWSTRNRAC